MKPFFREMKGIAENAKISPSRRDGAAGSIVAPARAFAAKLRKRKKKEGE
ncbi:MAG: hypothetical protein GKC10_05530 [Methanosarcinales archaeon]|nr:hypothetical protein [Methanosarcinales archaeon]